MIQILTSIYLITTVLKECHRELIAAPYAGEQSDYSDIDLPPTKEQARKLIHAYMACVSYVDRQVGKNPG